MLQILLDFTEIALSVYDEYDIHTSINIDFDISVEFFNGFNNSIEFIIGVDKHSPTENIFYRIMSDGHYKNHPILKIEPNKQIIYDLVIDTCSFKETKVLPEIWLVSYQYEAFPWDQWNISQVKEIKNPIGEPFTESVNGITSIDYVFIKNKSKSEAMIEGGKILSNYIKQFNYPQFPIS